MQSAFGHRNHYSVLIITDNISDTQMNKENIDYKQLAASRLRELEQCIMEKNKYKEECERLRKECNFLKSKETEDCSSDRRFSNDILTAMETSLKTHIEKCITDAGAKTVTLSESAKKGLVRIVEYGNCLDYLSCLFVQVPRRIIISIMRIIFHFQIILKSNIPVRAKPYVSAKNAVDMRKRVNAIVEAYWSPEERRHLYFKSGKNDYPKNARIITNKELADIRGK